MKNLDNIEELLFDLGYEYNLLSNEDKTYLAQIEVAVSEIFEREEKARSLLTKNHLSINNISDKTGIARQTIYNRRILYDYINLCKRRFSDNDLSLLRKLNEDKINQLQKELEIMRIRDIEIEELKIENVTLRRTIKNREEEIIRLKQKIAYTKSPIS